MQERISDFYISLPRLRVPWWTNFVIVLNDVLISAIECDGERGAGDAGCAFETRVGCDHVVSQNSTIAPSAHTQSIRISDSHLNYVIDARFQVFYFVMAPIGEDRARIFLPATRTTSVINGE